MIGKVQEFAIKELEYSQDELRNVLVNKGAIPPAPKLNNKDFARHMTGGDAKAFVECVAELVEGATNPTDRERYLKVLRTLKRSAAQAVKKYEDPANTTKPQLAPTGS
jgi:hypothetical protein